MSSIIMFYFLNTKTILNPKKFIKILYDNICFKNNNFKQHKLV